MAMYFFGKSATAVIEYFTHIMQLSNWIQKFQNSFLGFLFTFTGIILWLTLLLFYFSFFKYIFLILGSPLFALVSRKIEKILGREQSGGGITLQAQVRRGVLVALRNCGLQTIYLFGFILLSLVPVIGWITPLIVLAVECYYHGFSMLDYGFGRVPFSTTESRRFQGKHKGLAFSNGLMFYMMHVAIVLAPAYAIIAAGLTVHKVKDS
jgi:CysZ protein